jgi:phosphoglycerol transferase MdoB-like AlkP superfamily enzyme
MFSNIFLNRFNMTLVWHNWLLAILKMVIMILVLGATLYYSVKEEFIATRDVRMGYYAISASGSGFVDGSSKHLLKQTTRFGTNMIS